MNKPLSLALLIGGLVLLIYGLSAADSIGSSFSRFFTGAPTDKAIWLILGGAVAFIVGGAGLFRVTRSS
ncbi:MAG: DUF3185 family protein [Opitutae bacterium]|nr:DUF3185 family protein [Opitutae bacterium]